MGAFLDKPKTDKQTDTGEGNGMRYVVSAQQGWRVEMEDAHRAALGISDRLPDWSFYGVFDGHAGAETSSYCACHLLERVVEEMEKYGYLEAEDKHARKMEYIKATSATATTSEEEPNSDKNEHSQPPLAEQSSEPKSETATSASTERAKAAVDPLQWLSAADGHPEDRMAYCVRRAVRLAFLSADQCMREDDTVLQDRSGSTVVCALVSPTHVFLANCGDSRALLYSGDDIAVATVDHKPSCAGERARIEAAGGSVLMERVNGSLGVSRALGDFVYKEVAELEPRHQLVSPEPDVFTWKRDRSRDEFLVLACDGVWDVFKNKDLCAFIRSRLLVTDSLQDIAHQLLDTCLHLGSKDNMSVIIVLFEAAPTVDPEAVKREEKMKEEIMAGVDDYLERCNFQLESASSDSVHSACDSSSQEAVSRSANDLSRDSTNEDEQISVDTNHIVISLRHNYIANLPEGAGLIAMWQFIEDYAISKLEAKRRELRLKSTNSPSK